MRSITFVEIKLVYKFVCGGCHFESKLWFLTCNILDPFRIKYTKTIVLFNQIVFYWYKNKKAIRLCKLYSLVKCLCLENRRIVRDSLKLLTSRINLKFATLNRIESTWNVVYSNGNEIPFRMIANTMGFSNRTQF